VAAELGVPFFHSVEAMIEASAADAVLCAVPHPLHREVEVPCLEAGLHVLSEKPLAATPSDAKAIVSAARRNRRVLAVMYQYRQRPAVRKARQLIQQGAVGQWYYGAMHHGINRSQAYYDARDWRGTWGGEGGGVLVNQAPHPIDVMMHLVGRFPKRVIAFNNRLRHRMSTEDISTAILEYENGAQITLHADTIQLPTGESWCLHGNNGTLRLEGDSVTVQSVEPDLVTATHRAAGTTKPSPAEVRTCVHGGEGEDLKHAGVIQDFVDAVRFGRDPMVDGEWALRCVELHATIITSAATGRAVNFPVDHAAYDALLDELKDLESCRAADGRVMSLAA
jgi:UDP-N-acetyl-2-amino-2-deoxyglucuronate dehydrogenase